MNGFTRLIAKLNKYAVVAISLDKSWVEKT